VSAVTLASRGGILSIIDRAGLDSESLRLAFLAEDYRTDLDLLAPFQGGRPDVPPFDRYHVEEIRSAALQALAAEAEAEAAEQEQADDISGLADLVVTVAQTLVQQLRAKVQQQRAAQLSGKDARPRAGGGGSLADEQPSRTFRSTQHFSDLSLDASTGGYGGVAPSLAGVEDDPVCLVAGRSLLGCWPQPHSSRAAVSLCRLARARPHSCHGRGKAGRSSSACRRSTIDS
jgi:hypothetical protein